MADSITNFINGLEKLVQISAGVIIVAIGALTYWEIFSQDTTTNSTVVAAMIPGKVIDGLKFEINENIHKFHNELGFAEWIVYFAYGAIGFVAAFLALIFLLMLLKVRHNSKKFTNACTQTDSIRNVLHELVKSMAENDAMKGPYPVSPNSKTSLEGCENEAIGNNKTRNKEEQTFEKPGRNPLALRSPSTRARLDISCFKSHDQYISGDIVTRKSFTFTTADSPNGVVEIVQYYSTHYFMPIEVCNSPDGSSDLVDIGIPKIEITVDH